MFQVIVNQVDPKLMKFLTDDTAKFHKMKKNHIKRFSESTGFETNHFHYIKNYDFLNHEINARFPEGHEALEDLRKILIFEAPLIIQIEKVEKMEVENLTKEIGNMSKELKDVKQGFKNQEDGYKKTIEDLEKNMKLLKEVAKSHELNHKQEMDDLKEIIEELTSRSNRNGFCC